jgi:hypothetical protein
MVAVLKTAFVIFGERGFESHPLRQSERERFEPLSTTCLRGQPCISPLLYPWCKSLPELIDMKKALIIVNDKMQTDYGYELAEPAGKNFDVEFDPQLTPKEMLELGIFGGKYMTDCRNEFPRGWFTRARLCSEEHDPKLNFFGVNASQPLSVWRRRGWIHPDDPRGWFQWYCRYYTGRRHEDDKRQIRRWKAIKRHIAQIQNNCVRGDLDCRRKQRQAVLHWAYDSRRV